MSDSLIEQVKRLAEAKAHYARTGSSVLFDDLARDKIDFPALLAHMQAQQAVVDAAREWVETPRFRVDVARGDITPKGLALVAALEKESNAKG